ncbi:hypothetical protein J6590_005203 [Homalodisca vitripennis]|nr:hypothetical protein J6590_005203 [Homalodisca vitripennis]
MYLSLVEETADGNPLPIDLLRHGAVQARKDLVTGEWSCRMLPTDPHSLNDPRLLAIHTRRAGRRQARGRGYRGPTILLGNAAETTRFRRNSSTDYIYCFRALIASATIASDNQLD